jgi:large subunit ribosomal protein L17
MRHKNSGRKFGRDTSSRRAMLRNLAANLITHERIETTEAKAKELRRVAEKLITKAKRLGAAASTAQTELSAEDKAKRLATSRQLSSYLPRWGVKTDGTKVDIVEKVLVDLSKRFDGRPGGYTRTTKLGPRRGDGAQMTMIEFVDAAAPVDKIVGRPTEAAEPATAAAGASASVEAGAATATTADAEPAKEPSEG